jgi:hypothetical protein
MYPRNSHLTESRYPGSLVEINQDLLDRSDLREGLCPVEQVLDQIGEDVTLQTFVNDQHGQELTASSASLQFAPVLLGGNAIHQTVTHDLVDMFEKPEGRVLDASYGYGGDLACYI